MIKIKNLKTEKTERQIENEWKSIIGQKNHLLLSTDWTQLSDVPLANRKEFTKWRRGLRKINVRETFDSPSQALEFLNKYEERLPTPEFDFSLSTDQDEPDEIQTSDEKPDMAYQEQISRLEEKLHRIEQHVDLLNSVSTIPIEEARQIIVNHLKRDMFDNSEIRFIDFPILLGQVEQALDFLSDSKASIEDYYLLEKTDPAMDDKEYAHFVIQSYKQFLKDQKNIKKDYQERVSSVYDMSVEQINDFLQSNGYRYRCSD